MLTVTRLSCDNMAVLITLRAICLCLTIFFFFLPLFYRCLCPYRPSFSCTELGIELLPVWTWRKEVCPSAAEALCSHTITSNLVDLVAWSVPSARWQKILMEFPEGRLWKLGPVLIWCQRTGNCHWCDTSFLPYILYQLANVAEELNQHH